MSENKIHSNLEFRKVKSLKFLYEINENGTILRNVKSKKHAQIKKEDVQYVAYIKGQPVEIKPLLDECWGYETSKLPKTVCLTKNKEVLEFSSISAAASYIAKTQHRPFESVRQRIRHREHAYGYDISFPNAETRRAGSTEQGIVHLDQEVI